MATCGLCGLANPDGAGACQRCSASLVATPAWGAYGGHQPAPLGFPPQGYGPQGYGMQGYGPAGSYGAPLPGLATVGLWQERGVLVMQKNAHMPDRCVKCNAPTAAKLHRKLTWHHPALSLLILVSLLVYLVVAMLVRKSADVYIGVCADHLAKRRTAIIIGWSLGLVGLLAIFGAIAIGEGLVAVVGFITAFVGLFWGILGARLVHPSKIDDHYVWLKGVNAAYLAELPPTGR